MAWNKRDKEIKAPEEKVIGPGAPIVYAMSAGQKEGHHDDWDIERAFREGVKKVTWAFRAVDVIASNQARLPAILRKDNSPSGEIVTNNRILDVFNSSANLGENAFVFRYRLSSQVLLSTRGAFVEVIRGRDGAPTALHLLPPQHTAPIPHKTKFVSAFEVKLDSGDTRYLKPEDVIWIRRPHPLDPYLSLTPLEAAGIAVEIENLARLYNRNFLLNDGRPGGLLVVRGELNEDDRHELMTRFRGNVNRSGGISVIASEEGAEFVDTGSNPRDAAYTQMRQITKEEILAAFGVPESVIGNASGRCLHRDELVRLSSGERVPAIKLVGQKFKLLTATPDGHVEVDAWATLENRESIYRTTTASGRILETNGKHPLYAAKFVRTKDMGWRSEKGPGLLEQGWTPVEDLTAGHVVAVPSLIETTATNSLSTDEAFVLGALVGDGTMTGDGKPVGLATPESDFSRAFIEAVELLGDQVVLDGYGEKVDFWRVRANPENRKGSGRGARNSVRTRNLLRRVGLMGTTSHSKFVPEDVFMASRESIAAFLSGYFAADGNVHVGQKSSKGQTLTISATTVSKQLALDIQELLLRLGVNARIRIKQGYGGVGATKGVLFTSFEVRINTAEDILNFTDYVVLPGKGTTEIRQLAEARLVSKPRGGNVHGWRTRDLPPNLRWEKVASVEVVGTDDTVGIAVPGHHTYLSTFYEHNTFSNAAEEGRVFWMETMQPHLELLARGFDKLDDKYYLDFDTGNVPILILAKQERERYLSDEFSRGLISANEYRDGTGRKKVKAELADGLLVNPNLTPIGNTEKEMKPNQLDQGLQNAPLDVQSGQTPVQKFPQGTPPDGSAAEDLDADPNLENFGGGEGEELELEERVGVPGDIEMKRFDFGEEFFTKAEEDTDRWERIMDHALDRFFQRQQRVVLEKVKGKKARRALGAGTLTVDQVFDSEVWDRQLAEDIRPVLQGIVKDALETVEEKAAASVDLEDDDVQEFIDEQLVRVQKVNETTKEELAASVLVASAVGDDDDDGGTGIKAGLLVAAVGALFVEALSKRKQRIVDNEVLTSFNAGLYFAGRQTGAINKVWVTRGDEKVRPEHRSIHGDAVPIADGFKVDGAVLRFPKDPLAPPHLTMGCRCTLSFTADN